MKNTIKDLERLLSSELPDCEVSVDPPHDPSGTWWIDVRCGRGLVTAEYRPGKGFGLFKEDGGYGEGPVEIYRSTERVVRRLTQLLAPGQSAAEDLTLKDLRKLFGLSQAELADKAGVKQAAVSRLESRSDAKLSTLTAAVEALGGQLEIRAHFPDSSVPISFQEKRRAKPC